MDERLDDLKNITQRFAYIVPLERFVYKRGMRWNIDEPITEKGMKTLLRGWGLDAEGIKYIMGTSQHIQAYGHDIAPNQPDVFLADDGLPHLNTWVRPALVPATGKWTRLKLVIEWLTGGDLEGERWLLHWMAAKIQDPAFLPKVAVVFTTEQGGGKGTLAYVMRHILGPENTAVIERVNIESNFNSRWARKLFVLGDEVINGDRMKSISEKLKVLIDAGEVELEGKYKDQKAVRNRMAWMFASNSRIGPLDLDESDRRYTVFSNHQPLPPDYREMLNGLFLPDRSTPTPKFWDEIAAFAHDMLQLKVDRRFISRPHVNQDRAALIESSLSAHDLFFVAVEEGGLEEMIEHVVNRSGDWTLQKNRAEWDWGADGISTQMLYRCYVDYCQRTGTRPLRINKFGMAIRHHTPAWAPALKYVNALKRQVRGYVVPRHSPTAAPATTDDAATAAPAAPPPTRDHTGRLVS